MLGKNSVTNTCQGDEEILTFVKGVRLFAVLTNSSEQLSCNAPTVGVVGGGQLARMMQPPAVALGITLDVLVDDVNDAAAQVIPQHHVGAYTDPEVVRALATRTDVLTFEHEHVPYALLDELIAEGCQIQPPPSALIFAQNKIEMRRTLTEAGVQCPQWAVATSTAEIDAFRAAHGGAAVVKAATGGYDGKGVHVVRSAQDVEAVTSWLEVQGQVLVEELVDFVRELAVLVARTPSGHGTAWPVVESIQENGVCAQVIAPAPDLDAELAETSTLTALRIADELQVTGVMAVEGFETSDGRFLINELAMRPHNSGHWTIDGSVTSQFEQHLRAVLDLPLGDTSPTAQWSVMVNVLGGDVTDLPRAATNVMARYPDAKIHLYGKEVRPGRKVGHITVSGDDLHDVRDTASSAASILTRSTPNE